MAITTDLFRRSMSLFPGAVTLITTGSGDNRRGITATAVCSVSDSPPSLLVCVNRKSATCDAISATGRFSVQLLDEESDHIALAFAGKLQGADKFSAGDWTDTGLGQPRLTTALACLSCRVLTESDSGSHRIFVGEIEDAVLAEGGALVYARSRFHRLQAAG
ncbi:flavin reductase family protein [Paracoccus fontiphilus]|uniref:Flavin reductase family protein n=1 Tax=Paracoccus fontiphilus TaxID=1815556 RepID=A0ABV7IB06_9RHOB|nr:flavin reductase family protein [Paracoccus fontiphilus]